MTIATLENLKSNMNYVKDTKGRTTGIFVSLKNKDAKNAMEDLLDLIDISGKEGGKQKTLAEVRAATLKRK